MIFLLKKSAGWLFLFHKDDPWSSLINSLDQFTDDFMDNRKQSDQDSREKF
jgi:antitoxin VapB